MSRNLEEMCKNCKWWGRDYEGACDRIIFNKEDPTRIEARSDDDQGLDAMLVTAPNFSCNLFEWKVISQ